jgi:hypothetical protein
MRQLLLSLTAALAVGAAFAPSAAAEGCKSPGVGVPPGLGLGYRAGAEVLSTTMTIDGRLIEGPAREQALRPLLGSQFAAVWLDAWRDGWFVGLAPGTLDTDAARALILERLLSAVPAGFSAETIAHARNALHVVEQKWSSAELAATVAEVNAQLAALALQSAPAGSVRCSDDGHQRMAIELFDDTSAADEERIRALLAPYGDRVELTRRPGPRPIPGPLGAGDGPAPRPGPPPAVPARPAAAVVRPQARRHGASLRVAVSCPEAATTACAGTLTVRLQRRGARTGATLLRKPFAELAPGATRSWAVRLSRRQRTLLAGRRAAAKATATLRSGGVDGRTVALRLR